MLKANNDFLEKFDHALFHLLKTKDKKTGNIGVILSKNNLPTLQYNKEDQSIFLHSKYNPLQEAEKIIDHLDGINNYEHVFFYGIGLGYHVEELLKRFPNKKFVIVEPNIEVFGLYLEQRDFTKLPTKQLTHLKVGLSKEETESFLVEYFNLIQEKTLLVTLPSYERFIPEQYNHFVNNFKKLLEEKRQGILVNYSFQKRWTLNSWINLPTTIQTANILHDIDRTQLNNKPAIIVAAGPSLNDELVNLKYIKDHGLAYIFSVGSAINTLIENDIFPDAMCTYDPTVINQKVFEKVVNRNINTIPMIYGTSVGFETLSNYHGPKLHMVTSQDTISNYYLKRTESADINKVNDAPSIAVVTLELLYKLGCNPIILAGQNLAYKDKQTYSKDMGYTHVANELTDEEINRAIKVKSVEGNEILTNESFNRMRSQIEYYLLNVIKDTEVINTTVGGANIEGTAFERLSTLIKGKLKGTSIERALFSTKKSTYNLIYLENQLKDMEIHFQDLNDSLKKNNKLISQLEQLVVERKMVKLDKKFNKFDGEIKNFVKNPFYLTFLQPMSRVEFDLLTREINALKFEQDNISKAKKMINSFKRFLKSCEFDVKNMTPIFEQVNENIGEFLKDKKVKDVEDDK